MQQQRRQHLVIHLPTNPEGHPAGIPLQAVGRELEWPSAGTAAGVLPRSHRALVTLGRARAIAAAINSSSNSAVERRQRAAIQALYERPTWTGGWTMSGITVIPRQPREIWTLRLRLRLHRLAVTVRPAAAFTARQVLVLGLDRLVRTSTRTNSSTTLLEGHTPEELVIE